MGETTGAVPTRYAGWIAEGRPLPSDAVREWAEATSTLTAENARLLAALDAMQAERDAFPRLTQAMIDAACEGHYGVRRTRASGGAGGVEMTVNDRSYTFNAAFRRMWAGAKKAHLRDLATQEKPHGIPAGKEG